MKKSKAPISKKKICGRSDGFMERKKKTQKLATQKQKHTLKMKNANKDLYIDEWLADTFRVLHGRDIL